MLVSSIYTSHLSFTLLLALMDQIGEAMLQIKETLGNVLEGSVMELQERDIIRMGLTGLHMLGKLNPAQQGPIFTLVVLD